MKQTFEEIEQVVLALPDSERSKLVARLNESLADTSISDAWLRLAVTRLEGIRSGSRTPIDGPTGLKSMRECIRG
ncbi:MAG: addiction module protein [Pyrinomonadaceae bacterium]